MNNGGYKGVIKREAVYKCTNKDYLPEAKPRANDHFICKAKPSKGKKRKSVASVGKEFIGKNKLPSS